MTRKFIPVEQDFREDLELPATCDALEEEFTLAAALIKAREDVGMTQEQVAAAMGTTQAAVARLEGGRIRPTTRTLERFAKATRTKLRISFDPMTPRRISFDPMTPRGRRAGE